MTQYVASRKIADDPQLHGGRLRSQAHAPGQWPTHIYFDWWPVDSELAALTSVLDYFSNSQATQVRPLFRSELSVKQSLHVSLSPNIMLETEQRDTALKLVRSCMSQFKPFELTLGGTVVLLDNEQGTRRFVAIRVENGAQMVCIIVM
jgi:hypothetical protein